jgi:hypothetical protein
MDIDNETIRDALDRIARTPDGMVLYAFLQRETMGVSGDPDPSEGALRLTEGRRRFAHDLIGLMAQGIEASGRPDQLLVFTVRHPAGQRRAESITEWRRRSERERDSVRDPAEGYSA